MPSSIIKLVDVEEMNYLAAKGEGEVSKTPAVTPSGQSPPVTSHFSAPRQVTPLSLVLLLILQSHRLLFEAAYV